MTAEKAISRNEGSKVGFQQIILLLGVVIIIGLIYALLKINELDTKQQVINLVPSQNQKSNDNLLQQDQISQLSDRLKQKTDDLNAQQAELEKKIENLDNKINELRDLKKQITTDNSIQISENSIPIDKKIQLFNDLLILDAQKVELLNKLGVDRNNNPTSDFAVCMDYMTFYKENFSVPYYNTLKKWNNKYREFALIMDPLNTDCLKALDGLDNVTSWAFNKSLETYNTKVNFTEYCLRKYTDRVNSPTQIEIGAYEDIVLDRLNIDSERFEKTCKNSFTYYVTNYIPK